MKIRQEEEFVTCTYVYRKNTKNKYTKMLTDLWWDYGILYVF